MLIIHLRYVFISIILNAVVQKLCRSYRKPSVVLLGSEFFKQQIEI